MHKKKHILAKIAFTSSVLCLSIRSENYHPVVIATIPKSGTWMLEKCVSLLTGRQNALWKFVNQGLLRSPSAPVNSMSIFTPSMSLFNKCTNFNTNEFIIAHLVYRLSYERMLKEKNFKMLFIIRDPRDQVVSRAYYAKKHPTVYPGLQHLSIEELISGYIGVGSKSTQNFDDLFTSHLTYPQRPVYPAISHIVKFYRAFLPWAKSSISYTVKFEHLVGANGGGSLEQQLREIYTIGKHIGLAMTRKRTQEVADKLFGDSLTFREGKIGSWKTHFTQHQKDVFKKIAGKLLIELGYEKDLNW